MLTAICSLWIVAALAAATESQPAKDPTQAVVAAEPAKELTAKPAEAAEPTKDAAPTVTAAESAQEPGGAHTAITAAPAAQPAAAATAPSPDKKGAELVCRTERPAGTRIGKRVCRTKAEIEEQTEMARELMKDRDRKAITIKDSGKGAG